MQTQTQVQKDTPTQALVRRQSVDAEDEGQNSYTETHGMEMAAKAQGASAKPLANRAPLAQREAQTKFAALTNSRALALYANLQPPAERGNQPVLRIPKKKPGVPIPFASTSELDGG